MALNITNTEVEKLVGQLSKLTGESVTDAVLIAVRERLARLSGPSKPELAERLLQIGKECAAHIKEPYRSIDHGELLYDEKGQNH